MWNTMSETERKTYYLSSKPIIMILVEIGPKEITTLNNGIKNAIIKMSFMDQRLDTRLVIWHAMYTEEHQTPKQKLTNTVILHE